MKNYNEIAENILLRRDKYEKSQRKKRKKMLHISSLASCFIFVAILGIGIWQSGWLEQHSLPISKPSSQEGNNVETTNNSPQEQTINKITTEPTTQQPTNQTTQQPTQQNNDTPPDEGNIYSGGEAIDGWYIPVLPFDREIKLTGDAITDAEAQEYFNKNKNNIIGSLSASGVSSDFIKISKKGYCHVTYNGEEEKSFEVRQNYRDYLVYNGDELVAIITLYKENGEIFNTPSFGAKWFDDYNSYLQNHKGEKLVYAYAGWFEIIIAPDNTYYNPMGLDVKPYLAGVDNPYEIFYHEAVVYTP